MYMYTCVVFPGRQGELALKAVEFVQTGMPMPAASAVFAPLRQGLSDVVRQVIDTHIEPSCFDVNGIL